ncbi:LCP family protein [Paenibacillus sp. PK4536]|uniref:Transcriptional regulator LytR n=1 Tax=Paenibacillus nuruki TaxID=1886670 RepID=A0A1E3L8E1_9BACL|nr:MULTISPECIES: LCP family protein [Paenibacillus]ODP29455.1 Transcriptional regulator LytR [Paenibacillus nuruki]TKJ88941.1 LytR family transcriptional regulator [Paenibacillus sp. CFBP13512]WIM40364.1 LCP family protein [Paenibacillus sp. PK4536]CAJ1317297.1 Transcriptional regulator LytR [Paenibacillus nuruki]
MARKRKIAIGAAIALVVVAGSLFLLRKPISALMFDWFVAGSIEDQLEQTYQPVRQIGGEQEATEELPVLTEPFSMLLVGSDQRDNETARSDTLIFAVMRPLESKVLLISIPRDTYTEIVGKGKKDKINHAYAFGGIEMSMDTVENLMDEKLNYYATINFQGLIDSVDALGGIKLPIEEDIVNKDPNHEQFTIEGGKPIYTGQDALYYVRYREDSDFRRTKRQQIFLQALADQAIQLNQIEKIPQLLTIMGNNFKTDMRPQTITGLASQILRSGKPEVTSFTIAGDGEYVDGVYYEVPRESEIKEARDLINEWMKSDASDSDINNRDSADRAAEPADSQIH